MIKKSIFVILLFLAVYSVFPVSINLIANSIQLPTSFPTKPSSYPTSLAKPSKVDITDGIQIDMTNIDEYAIFEPTDVIENSGKFRIQDTFFEFTIYKNDKKQELQYWIIDNYPPYIFNEDQFSKEFSTKEDRKFNDNTYIMTNKVDNAYFVSYFRNYKNKVIVITLQLGKYDKKDISKLIESIQVNEKSFDDSNDFQIINSLTSKEEQVRQFNQFKNSQKQISLNIKTKNVFASSSYFLPWTNGATYYVAQDWGSNDSPPCTGPSQCSHYGISGYAYDFGLPESTDVLASAAGTVSYIHSGETSCGGSGFINNANYITVAHADGKATEYHHLKTVTVTLGAQVQQGQIIGQSGKTGFTAFDGVNCAAHLHFQKQLQGGAYTQSEPFYFAEYPNVSQGEIVYGSYPISQNILTNNDCNGINSVMTDWHTNGPINCNPISSLTILPVSTIGGEVTITVH
ncbi:MAG: peptidoglycan DD-metalloendopeptidase family protein [Candidatus Dojkabacteria bacterium]